MALVVGGFGVAHSPQLCIPPEGWRPHGDRELATDRLAGLTPTSRAKADLEHEITDGVIAARHAACQDAMDRVGSEISALEPTAVVVVGDDERELFGDDGMPTMAIFWGDQITDIPPGRDKYPATMWTAYGAYHADEPEDYEVAAGLGLHMVQQLVADGFDVTQLSLQPHGRSIGHAFTFLRRRIMGGASTPIVPVFLNTYYPPNQPTVARCIALGRALRKAIDGWDEAARVVLVASGGLSHPIIDEDLDRSVLAALATMDEAALCSIPSSALVDGSSEIRNWIVVGAALEDHHLDTIAYIPAYRSLAGSGCGMGFAAWRDLAHA